MLLNGSRSGYRSWLKRDACLLLILIVSVLLILNIDVTFLHSADCPLMNIHKDHLTPVTAEDVLPEILGRINPDKRYAVFAVTSQSWSDVFLLPGAVVAWKRIGFDSVVVIVGSLDVWNSDKKFFDVLSLVRQLEAVVIFLLSHSQVDNLLLKQVLLIYLL